MSPSSFKRTLPARLNPYDVSLYAGIALVAAGLWSWSAGLALLFAGAVAIAQGLSGPSTKRK